MMRLGVNIDHVATVREVRHGFEPEPVIAALIAQGAGADSIVVHLREDRRHINDRDLFLIRKAIKVPLNLEMSTVDEIVGIACKVKPDRSTLVPEKRQEITTEGGLDVVANLLKVSRTVNKLRHNKIETSLFIDPQKNQIMAAKKCGVRMVELHTGRYAEAKGKRQQDKALNEIKVAVNYAKMAGLSVFAGHGLDYHNVSRVAVIEGIEELNIGYSIVCRSVLSGLDQAVKEMRALL